MGPLGINWQWHGDAYTDSSTDLGANSNANYYCGTDGKTNKRANGNTNTHCKQLRHRME